jgi:glutamate 5-kinase
MSERAQYLTSVRNLVIKLGTQLLSDAQGKLDSVFVAGIADQVADLRARGVRVTIVSSGAIGCGLSELGLTQRPTDLSRLQAVAAVGQRRLMDVWAAAFRARALHVGQLLVTREDIDDRARYLNLRNTILALQEMNAVPIINENDSVSTDELVKISFGDNDILAAMLAHAIRADLLVLLSVVDGLLDPDDKPIRLVHRAADNRGLVRETKSASGKGGMDSKLLAAQMVNDSGEAMVVANGRDERILTRLLAGEELGTLFLPEATRKRSSRSRWIGAVRPAGTVIIDDGARRALAELNKSLLPAGIVKIEGDFARGDVVAITDAAGKLIAKGLTNYSAAEMQTIRGKKTSQVRQLLADAAYDEAVHRDNLALERQ